MEADRARAKPAKHDRGRAPRPVLVAAVLASHQQWLIRARDPDLCFRAFLNNNLVGLAVFAGILLHYLFAG